MSRWKRLCGVAVLATSALVFAGAGAADNSITVPYVNEASNDCNGEIVEVQGTMHIEEHSTTNANGTHDEFTINLVGVKGVAPGSGAGRSTTFGTTCAST